jgi:hypothetical protein
VKYTVQYVDADHPEYNRQIGSGPLTADTPAAALQTVQGLGQLMLRPSPAPDQPSQLVDLAGWTATVTGDGGNLASPAYPGQTVTVTPQG